MATSTAAATGKAKSVEERVAESNLERDIEQLKADMAMLRDHIQKTGKDSYRAARRAANDGIDRLKTEGEAAMASARSSARDIEDQLTETVREKPITSLAIAAGIGFLFALFTRR